MTVYPIEINGETLYPGGDYKKFKERQAGCHKKSDWTWRWGKEKFAFGLENGFIVLKKGKDGKTRIYTKTYLHCTIEKQENGKFSLDYPEQIGKAYTTLSFMENEVSNDAGKRELDKIFPNANDLFKNPKPSKLITNLIKMVCNKKDACILDFFAGSGTTGQAVLELNRMDQGTRQFILCTNNEITNMNPNGIAYDVTSKRLKRVMCGECYDGKKEFEWLKTEEPYKENLEVYEIKEIANFDSTINHTPFDVIDETLYGLHKFTSLQDKIEWVCEHFEYTQKILEKITSNSKD